MIKYPQWLGFILLNALFLAACHTPYYEKSYEIKSETLGYDDVLEFRFDILDTLTEYDVLLELTHSPEYPYQNIYFELGAVRPERDSSKESFSINLANKFGYWNGDCWGDNCTLKVPLQQKTRFPELGTRILTLRQYTRKEKIKGIKEVKLIIEEFVPES